MRFNGLNILFAWSSLVPALAALLLAAPFVLDLDNGTYRLYWTQSVTRRRWIVTKLTLAGAAVVAVAGCLVVLATWSRAPIDHLNGRMSTNAYDVEGIVPVAYALFVFGVAVALGALWRRTVPALLVAFVVYVVGRTFMDSWLRQRLLSPVKTTWLGRAGAVRTWIMPWSSTSSSATRVDTGSRASLPIASEAPAVCSRIRASARSRARSARVST